jgi:hypothetical protein
MIYRRHRHLLQHHVGDALRAGIPGGALVIPFLHCRGCVVTKYLLSGFD